MAQKIFVGDDRGIAWIANDLFIGVDGVAARVVKGYIGVDGVARLFYEHGPSFSIEFSGAHTREFISVDGVERELITITGSGILTVTGKVDADVCLVSGGENGLGSHTTTAVDGGTGGRGGKLLNQFGFPLVTGAVQIGAGNNGDTSYAGLLAHGTGTGAGLPYSGSDRSRINGDGIEKRPFGLSWFELTCGGGGSGASSRPGGPGGTNGGNGGIGVGTGRIGGVGGARGGGNGGANEPGTGGNATYYGSGGGGGGSYGMATYIGGNGYQGVMYILLPAA